MGQTPGLTLTITPATSRAASRTDSGSAALELCHKAELAKLNGPRGACDRIPPTAESAPAAIRTWRGGTFRVRGDAGLRETGGCDADTVTSLEPGCLEPVSRPSRSIRCPEVRPPRLDGPGPLAAHLPRGRRIFMVLGLMLPSTVAFIAGLVAVGSSAPDGRMRSATAARVRTWMWLDKSRIESR